MKITFKMLILFLLLLAQIPSFASEIKFIHITDTNVNKENAYKLQETIKEINSYGDIDFVVFGGNNIQKASVENLNYFTHLLKKVHKKTYVLLGSSDVLASNGIDKKYYFKRIRKVVFNHSKNPNYVFKKKDCVFIAMDGSKQYFQSSNGYYGNQELLWLNKELEKYKDKNVVILQHFPLIPTKSKWAETSKTEEYIALLKKYKNVKLIVSGHYGNDFEIKAGGIYHIITESYSKNNAYKVIELDFDKNYVGTYLVK